MKKTSQGSVHSSVVKQAAFVCLLLITSFAFAEATHLHSIATSGAEGRCDFCLAVHANVAAVPVASVAVVLDRVPTQVLRTKDSKASTLLHGSDLYSRPPPLV